MIGEKLNLSTSLAHKVYQRGKIWEEREIKQADSDNPENFLYKFSMRARNALRNAGIYNKQQLEDYLKQKLLTDLKNMGVKSATEIYNSLGYEYPQNK